MKKFFTLIAAVAMAASVNAQVEQVVIPEVDAEGTYAGEHVLKTTNSQIVLGADNENFKIKPGKLADDQPYVSYVTGSNNAKDAEGNGYKPETKNLPSTGCYYVFTATKAGKLSFGMQLGGGKPFFVVDGDTGENIEAITLLDKTGANASLGTDYTVKNKFYGTVNFDVSASKPYYVFCTGSKLAFYGYQFTPGTSTGITSIETSASAKSTAIYNLAGQQVSSSYKGIVIKNGKKVLNNK